MPYGDEFFKDFAFNMYCISACYSEFLDALKGAKQSSAWVDRNFCDTMHNLHISFGTFKEGVYRFRAFMAVTSKMPESHRSRTLIDFWNRLEQKKRVPVFTSFASLFDNERLHAMILEGQEAVQNIFAGTNPSTRITKTFINKELKRQRRRETTNNRREGLTPIQRLRIYREKLKRAKEWQFIMRDTEPEAIKWKKLFSSLPAKERSIALIRAHERYELRNEISRAMAYFDEETPPSSYIPDDVIKSFKTTYGLTLG